MKKSPFQRIGFIGLGLIGGSIAKTIRRIFPDTKMIALASRAATVHVAHRDGLIDNSELLPLSAFSDCDLIFLCSPVKTNISYLEELSTVVSKDTLLTDVGSVKGDIHTAVSWLGLSSQFIGGHPMTGSEKIGYQNATDRLLENAYYILTKTEAMEEDLIWSFRDFIEALGALPLVLSPEEHDFATAAISHLPHIVSAALVNLVQGADSERAVMKTIAAGGFKDITRISSSSPVMWQNICLENRDEILKLLSLFEEELSRFKTGILFSNEEALLSLFSEAKNYRDSLPLRKSGAMPALFEFYCDLNDEAGQIAKVATLLADADISIKNIGIIHNREFESGALHIEMYEEDAMQRAITLLRDANYTVYERN